MQSDKLLSRVSPCVLLGWWAARHYVPPRQANVTHCAWAKNITHH